MAQVKITDEAVEKVFGERQEDYGHPADDFKRSAAAINALYGTNFQPHDIPVLMSLMKLSRLVQSPRHRDSWVDMVGYALTAERVAEREGRPLR